MVKNNPKTILVRWVIAIIKKILLKIEFSANIITVKNFTPLAQIAITQESNQNEQSINRRSERGETGGTEKGISRISREVGRMGKRAGSTPGDLGENVRASEERYPRVLTPEDLQSKNFCDWFEKLQVAKLNETPTN